MTIGEALDGAEKELKKHAIDSFRLDSQILLEFVLGKDKSYLLAHPDIQLSKKQIRLFNKFIKLRSLNKPVAQIIKQKEFYGNNFYINNDVLIPRPESEEFITQFEILYKNGCIGTEFKIADLGTGSGAIGITIKKIHPNLRVDLIDRYSRVLRTTKKNVVGFNNNHKLIRSNLLKNSANDYDVILANLPYVPLKININMDAKHEPRTSIFSGDDGLNHYREMYSQISKLKIKPLYLILEYLEISDNDMSRLSRDNNYMEINHSGLVHTFELIR